MENQIEKFNQEAKSIMQNVALLATQKKEIEKEEKAMREELLQACERYGVDSIDNEFLKITRVEASQTKSIDTKKIAKMDPALYEELEREYTKITQRKSYLRITPKEVG